MQTEWRVHYEKYERVFFICVTCGEKKPCKKINLYQDKICRACKSRAQLSKRGAEHPAAHVEKTISYLGFDKYGLHWKGPRYTNGQRQLAIARDGGHCRVPNCFENHVEVHHIVRFRDCESHQLSNLITLCKGHHDSVERFIDKTGARPFVWPFQDFIPDDPPAPPVPVDTEEPPF